MIIFGAAVENKIHLARIEENVLIESQSTHSYTRDIVSPRHNIYRQHLYTAVFYSITLQENSNNIYVSKLMCEQQTM